MVLETYTAVLAYDKEREDKQIVIIISIVNYSYIIMFMLCISRTFSGSNQNLESLKQLHDKNRGKIEHYRSQIHFRIISCT